jgi:hypothetical protein
MSESSDKLQKLAKLFVNNEIINESKFDLFFGYFPVYHKIYMNIYYNRKKLLFK